MRYFTEVTIDAIVTLLETSKKLNRIRSVVAHKSSFAYERDLLFNNAATAKVSRAIYYYVCTAKQLRTAAALGREVAELLSKIPYTAPNTDVIKLLAELESKYLSADLPRDPREIQREIQSSAATDQKTKPVAHHKSRVLQPSEKIPLTLLRSLKMRRIPD